MTTPEKRLERFAEVVSILKDMKITQSDISQRMKRKDSTYISKVLNGVRECSLDFLEDFIHAFPEFNLNYIKYNQGPIFISDENAASNIISEPMNAFYDTNKSNGSSNIQQQIAPLMVYNLEEQSSKILTKSEGVLSFPGSQTCDFAVRVHGEAMRGAICNGGSIAVKQIDKNILPFGHIFLIRTEHFDMVRYVRKGSDNKLVKLYAHNNHDFDDFEIPLESILEIFLVHKILNNES